MALLVMSIIMASSIALSGIVMQGLKISRGLDDSVVAFYAAESGIEENLYLISTSPPPPPPPLPPPNPTCSESPPSPLFNNREVTWVRTCTFQSSGSREVILRATGIYHTSRMALQVRMLLN